uniref:Uncharacterized protein n=1 Tax=Oryza glumipatula TaxID=40148 RepID=A0A0E0BJX3_9ORYZ
MTAGWASIPLMFFRKASGTAFSTTNWSSFQLDRCRGVSFEDGVLNIPQILLYDNAERTFLNLMAFERLHPGAGNDVTSFVFFMDLLIDTAKDVALLRSKEIIKNGLGNDKVVADLISNTLTRGAIISKDNSLKDVIREVNAHYKKPWNKWRASFIHTYFINPWVFILLVAAVILLIATVMQTVYTILSTLLYPSTRTKISVAHTHAQGYI